MKTSNDKLKKDFKVKSQQPTNGDEVKASLQSILSEDDQQLTQQYVQDTCRPLIFCLKLLALDVTGTERQEGPQVRRSRPLRTWRVFLILLCLVSSAEIFYGTYYLILDNMTGNRANYQAVIYLEPLLTALIIYKHTRREAEIAKLFADILRTTLIRNPSIGRQLRKVSWLLTTTTLLAIAIHLAQVSSKFKLMTVDDMNLILRENYLGLSFENPTMTTTLTFWLDYYYILGNVIYVDMYTMLIVFLCCALYRQVHQLNEDIKSRTSLTCEDLQAIERSHHSFAILVNNLSRLFSPVLTWAVVILVVKIIFGLKETRFPEDNSAARIVFFYENIMIMLKSCTMFTILVLPPAKLFRESQRTMEIVANMFIASQQELNDGVCNYNNCKNCSTTILFASRQLSIPVGVTGSNLFTLNDGFLVLVISSIVTYLSVLS